MKKLTALILCLALCLLLTGCPLDTTAPAEVPETQENQQTQSAPAQEVVITVGPVESGMVVGEIPVTVTVDGEPVDCTTEWVAFSEEGYWTLDPVNNIPENYWGRLDVYYDLPLGTDLETLEVTIDAPGGTYDGTGDVGFGSDGGPKAWSHIAYEPDSTASGEPDHTHDWVLDTGLSRTPTCAENGWDYYTCSTCGMARQEPLGVLGHSYGEPQVTKTPTCVMGGQQTITCTVCGDSYTEFLPSTGKHSLSEPSVTPPTCTDNGTSVTHCTVCGSGFIDEIPAPGHSWSAFTYYSGRYHQRTCGVCGETEQASHTIPSGSVTCSGCGADIVN